MKRNGISHVAKQMHEVFHPTTSSSKRDSKIGYSETIPRRRELVLGIPRIPTHKTDAQTPAYQLVKTTRYISVLLKMIVTCLQL